MRFFSRIPVDKKQIEAAIVRLENESSAELRVYIERKLPKTSVGLSAVERALQVFDELDMHKTSAQNSVLIYIGYKDHLCAIIGDKGIHQFVNEAYWQQQCDLMIEQFKLKSYTKGIVEAIDRIADTLKTHFPIQLDDKNELSNEVIIHD
ncbi:TPM domain-containing protein [Rodentibacter genomosp. 2]|uniref:TPM domain-containing protein n=1 Tax=Rodentibacter genomosp. 2 TaxID=1908266 RepID=A0A1V3JC76_9PAST|nr:TPM domain-containing protein [Rodentibacter genomosp. 2]OOF54293.1 hypothetical protein BKK55_09450 [Rodentibacter genomosp. 2]OOF57185.1 hypothetical protein BKK56_01620 [Rodentibacter genomosp. 2]